VKINWNPITSVATAILVVMGFLAYIEYRKVNKMSTFEELDGIEHKIQDIVINDDKLSAFWVSYTDNNIKRVSVNKLNILTSNIVVDNTIKRLIIHKLDHVSELELLLYSENMFDHPAKKQLRKCYTLAETILYLVGSAHHAKCSGMINGSTFRTYSAYLHSVGDHPIFLAAISYGHDYGFYEKDFATFLRNYYIHDTKLLPTMRALYPEMETSDWVNTLGKF